MKIKTISRSQDISIKHRAQDIAPTAKNLDPELHPFERAREYTRALNATKLERLFAAPFVAALSGHIDGVYRMERMTGAVNGLISASGDGEIKIWSLSERKATWSVQGHRGFVTGLASVPSTMNSAFSSSRFISVGADKTVKLWDYSSTTLSMLSGDSTSTMTGIQPIQTFTSKSAFNGLDHHRRKNWFVTASDHIDVWDHERAEPINRLSWGADTINTVKLNQTETSILASCGSDRTVILYDLRTMSPVSKVILEMRSNAISWNPMEAFNFTVANEDHNCYTFDMRNLGRPSNILKDHVSAVLDVEYSPTGQEILTGSYDKTVRIFDARQGHSRDVYHTKRMARIFCVKWSWDNKFVLSGSDDGNVRIWRAKSSEKTTAKSVRERSALNYVDQLKKRYKNMPEISRISSHRHVPKPIKRARQVKQIQTASIKRKIENIRRHSKPDTLPKRADERSKKVIALEK